MTFTHAVSISCPSPGEDTVAWECDTPCLQPHLFSMVYLPPFPNYYLLVCRASDHVYTHHTCRQGHGTVSASWPKGPELKLCRKLFSSRIIFTVAKSAVPSLGMAIPAKDIWNAYPHPVEDITNILRMAEYKNENIQVLHDTVQLGTILTRNVMSSDIYILSSDCLSHCGQCSITYS